MECLPGGLTPLMPWKEEYRRREEVGGGRRREVYVFLLPQEI